MADSTVADINKMKVVDLRKELKTRGLSAAGDKAELISRLHTAMTQASDSNDEHGDINLDSDIDSDGVLEDEDDKSHGDILDDSAVDTLTEDLALAEQPAKPEIETKPHRILKRKIIASDTNKSKSDDDKTGEKEPSNKKIVLNRTISITSTKPTEEKADDNIETTETPVESNKVKITADIDSKSKLEYRAKRFGLPVQMSEAERKEARMKRFGQVGSADSTTNSSIKSVPTGSLSENLDKLKKRAERFGQSVSKIMTDIENKEKLEKRKAKFAAV